MFDYDVLIPPGGPDTFVGTLSNVTGSVATAIGNVTYTIDGQQTSSSDTSPIPGCSVTNGVFFDGHGSINAFQATATSTGSDVAVTAMPTFTDPITNMEQTLTLDITFSQVTGAGNTVVTAVSNLNGAVMSSNFVTAGSGYQATFFDVSTDAALTGPITICQHYADTDNDGVVDGTMVNEASLVLLHGEGNPPQFVDRTSSRDLVNNIICADVSSLSPFVVAVNTAGASMHDSVVLPVAPVKVTIPASKDPVVKKIRVAVTNADLSERGGHQIRLTIVNNSCPQSVLRDDQNHLVTPDFGTGNGDTILVGGGKTKTAAVSLRIVAGDFSSLNAKSPIRCSMTVTATSIDVSNVTEINASNNTATVVLDVVDKHDF
jgi:hypothetical protein